MRYQDTVFDHVFAIAAAPNNTVMASDICHEHHLSSQIGRVATGDTIETPDLRRGVAINFDNSHHGVRHLVLRPRARHPHGATSQFLTTYTVSYSEIAQENSSIAIRNR